MPRTPVPWQTPASLLSPLVFFSRIPDKGWSLPQDTLLGEAAGCLLLRGEALWGGEIFLKGSCWSTGESLPIKWYTVLTFRRASSVWSYLYSHSGAEEREGACLSAPKLSCQERAALRKMNILALIFLWGKIFPATGFLPFRYKEGGDRNGWIPQMEHIKDESIFEFLYTTQSCTHAQKLFYQTDLVTRCNVLCWVCLLQMCSLTGP